LGTLKVGGGRSPAVLLGFRPCLSSIMPACSITKRAKLGFRDLGLIIFQTRSSNIHCVLRALLVNSLLGCRAASRLTEIDTVSLPACKWSRLILTDEPVQPRTCVGGLFRTRSTNLRIIIIMHTVAQSVPTVAVWRNWKEWIPTKFISIVPSTKSGSHITKRFSSDLDHSPVARYNRQQRHRFTFVQLQHE